MYLRPFLIPFLWLVASTGLSSTHRLSCAEKTALFVKKLRDPSHPLAPKKPDGQPVILLVMKRIGDNVKQGEEFVIYESPYIISRGHEALYEDFRVSWGNDAGIVIYAGEAIKDAQGRYLRATPTSGWAANKGFAAGLTDPKSFKGERKIYTDLFDKALKQVVPGKIPPGGVKHIPFNPKHPHLDSRLNQLEGSNARHDILGNLITVMTINAESLYHSKKENRPIKDETRNALFEYARGAELYMLLAEQDGLDISNLRPLIAKLIAKQDLDTEEYQALSEGMRAISPYNFAWKRQLKMFSNAKPDHEHLFEE